MKNKIVIYTGCFEEKKKVELYNFQSMDHYKDSNTGKYYIRVCCDNRYYYYLLSTSVVAEIKIYE